LYDIDGNGQISKDEMVRIISAVFAMVGSHKKIELTAEEKVDQMFESMDLDGNAEISKEEFFEGARHDKSVVEALGGMI
jgi:Ca2+-binding EF-hand superfamily protein